MEMMIPLGIHKYFLRPVIYKAQDLVIYNEMLQNPIVKL